MRRHELSDDEWAIIAPLLPNKVRGAARVDDHRVLNGILWRFRTGAPWRDVPERYGPRTTLYNRFVRWRAAGVWDRLLEAVSAAYDGGILMIDSSCVRVHHSLLNGDCDERNIAELHAHCDTILLARKLGDLQIAQLELILRAA